MRRGTRQRRLPPAASKGKYDQRRHERHDEPKSEMLRDAQLFAGAQRSNGPFQVDELGQEDFFQQEQTGENRGTHRQSAGVQFGRRRHVQAMTLAPALVARRPNLHEHVTTFPVLRQ